jgi:tRNA(fMet)-specific endonuclease VapC
MRILSFTEPAIARFERLRAMKLGVGAMDLRIAAIALEHGATVVTRNTRDFQRIPGLPLDDWSQPPP